MGDEGKMEMENPESTGKALHCLPDETTNYKSLQWGPAPANQSSSGLTSTNWSSLSFKYLLKNMIYGCFKETNAIKTVLKRNAIILAWNCLVSPFKIHKILLKYLWALATMSIKFTSGNCFCKTSNWVQLILISSKALYDLLSWFRSWFIGHTFPIYFIFPSAQCKPSVCASW